MPARGDHDARRADVSEALWRVLSKLGVGGLTMRAIATEMGATTGLVNHYFATKKDLISHARQLAEQRTTKPPRLLIDSPGIDSLRNALQYVLPLDEASIELNRAWVGFWDVALRDTDLAENERARYERWRTALRVHIKAGQKNGEITKDSTADVLVEMTAAFAHGLVVQSLFDSVRFSPQRQRAVLEAFLDRLRVT